MLRTQIGGKYHRDDDSVFRLKARMVELGVSVSHPIADEIKTSIGDHGFAFDPSGQSFADVERSYYNSIAASDFHTVCNQFGPDLGYTGASASLEIAFAMCHRVPIVLLHPARITCSVDSYIRSFLLPRLDRVIVCDLLSVSDDEIANLLLPLDGEPVEYTVSMAEWRMIETRVAALLRSLQADTADVPA
jgi:hypothetical protein